MLITTHIKALPPSLQRVTALGLFMLLALGMSVATMQVVPWLLNLQSHWRLSAGSQLAKARGWIQHTDTIHQRETALASAAVWEQFYAAREGATPRDRIQHDVTAMVTDSGAGGPDFEMIESRDETVLETYAVKVTASFTAGQLQSVLAALRAHSPYLRVQRIEVTAPQLEAHYQNPILLVVIEVAGYAIKAPQVLPRSAM